MTTRRKKGAHVVALTLPDLMRLRASRVLEDLPGWREVVALGPEERQRAVADPETRRKLRAGAEEAVRRGLGAIAQPELLEIADAPAGSAAETLVGRSIADVAAERGADPVDILIDVVLPDRLPFTMVFPSLVPSLGRSDEGWHVRASVWRDDRTVLGGSDAGAHADLMCHANYTTMLLGESVRDRQLLTLEDAVHQLTDVPARLYGLRDRGRVAEGWIADLVVFDPARVGSGPPQVREDLPGGGERLYVEARGIAARARERTRDRLGRAAHRRSRGHVATVRPRHRHRHCSGSDSMSERGEPGIPARSERGQSGPARSAESGQA